MLSKKKKLPSWAIFPIIGVLILITIIISLFTSNTPKHQNVTLNVVEVSTGTVQEVYNTSGLIESEQTKTYYSPVTAPIASNHSIVGQPVKSGDVLITYDTSSLERDNQQAILNLQSAKNASEATRAQNAKAIDAANAANAAAAEQINALAETVNTLATQVNEAYHIFQQNQANAASMTNELNTQRQTLQQKIEEKKQILTQNQAVIDSVETGYAGLRYEAEQLKQQLSKDPTFSLDESQQALVDAFDNYDIALAQKSTAQAELEQLEEQLNSLVDPTVDDAGYSQLKAQYDAAYAQWQSALATNSTVQTETGMTSSELTNLDISDNLAELAALTPAELVAKGQEGIKADMNGVIASVELGQTNLASQGMPLVTIASTDQVRVKIEISPDDYSKFKTGTEAEITIGEHKYKGVLSSIDKIAMPNSKGNSVIGGEIHITNPDSEICIGASAKISMVLAQSKDVLVVPTEVINLSSEGDFVYIIEDGIVKKCPVEVGTTSTSQAEILSGLKEGDQVVSDLNTDIKEGMTATALSSKK